MHCCPFCGAENENLASSCQVCARRLPPHSPCQLAKEAELPAAEVSQNKRTEERVEPLSELVAPGEAKNATSLADAERLVVSSGEESQSKDEGQECPAPEGADVLAEVSQVDRMPLDPRDLQHRPLELEPLPDVPDGGLWSALRYTLMFARARWQRWFAAKKLKALIVSDTAKRNLLLGKVGALSRALELYSPPSEAENQAVDRAELERSKIEKACAEIARRQSKENAKFDAREAEREGRISEVQVLLDDARAELARGENQRRELWSQRKALERQEKSCWKEALSNESKLEKMVAGEKRERLQKGAERLRCDAQKLASEQQALALPIDKLKEPIAQLLAKLAALKTELDSARRSLGDVREGHRVRVAEIQAERKRQYYELEQVRVEIQQRLCALGMLVNLHRVEHPELEGPYRQIDKLRHAIAGRASEMNQLNAEIGTFDKSLLLRGSAVLAGIVVLSIALISVLVALG